MKDEDLIHQSISFFGDAVWGSLEPSLEIEPSHVNYCNLEGSLIFGGGNLESSPNFDGRIRKVGPSLSSRGQQFTRGPLQDWLFSVANNHSMDFGWAQLEQTIQQIGVNRVQGAGQNEESARRPLFLEIGGHRVAIVACSDRFFGAQTQLHPGVAQINAGLDWVSELVSHLNNDGAVTFVVLHGGMENFPIPSPSLRSQAQGWIRAGASGVIINHPHIPLPSESYLNGWIHYGLGNFIVNPGKWSRVHPHSLISKRATFKIGSHGLMEAGYSYLAVKSINPFRVSVSEAPAKVVDEIENWHAELLDVINEPETHEEVFALLGAHFLRKFARKQILLGALGLYLARSKVFQKVFQLKGKLSSRLYQGFGPHLLDIFSPSFTRDLVLGGIENFYEIREPSSRSIAIAKKIIAYSESGITL